MSKIVLRNEEPYIGYHSGNCSCYDGPIHNVMRAFSGTMIEVSMEDIKHYRRMTSCMDRNAESARKELYERWFLNPFCDLFNEMFMEDIIEVLLLFLLTLKRTKGMATNAMRSHAHTQEKRIGLNVVDVKSGTIAVAKKSTSQK